MSSFILCGYRLSDIMGCLDKIGSGRGGWAAFRRFDEGNWQLGAALAKLGTCAKIDALDGCIPDTCRTGDSEGAKLPIRSIMPTDLIRMHEAMCVELSRLQDQSSTYPAPSTRIYRSIHPIWWDTKSWV